MKVASRLGGRVNKHGALLPVALMVLLSLMNRSALAVIETYEFSDPSLEARYHQLSQELRCPKCQNQNIADSNAPISRDLRALLHQQLEDGASDQEILDFMVARYGEFVRYRPGLDPNTLVLWGGPAVLTLMGIAGLGWHLSRRRRAPASPVVTEHEREALRARLRDLEAKESQ